MLNISLNRPTNKSILIDRELECSEETKTTHNSVIQPSKYNAHSWLTKTMNGIDSLGLLGVCAFISLNWNLLEYFTLCLFSFFSRCFFLFLTFCSSVSLSRFCIHEYFFFELRTKYVRSKHFGIWAWMLNYSWTKWISMSWNEHSPMCNIARYVTCFCSAFQIVHIYLTEIKCKALVCSLPAIIAIWNGWFHFWFENILCIIE